MRHVVVVEPGGGGLAFILKGGREGGREGGKEGGRGEKRCTRGGEGLHANNN